MNPRLKAIIIALFFCLPLSMASQNLNNSISLNYGLFYKDITGINNENVTINQRLERRIGSSLSFRVIDFLKLSAGVSFNKNELDLVIDDCNCDFSLPASRQVNLNVEANIYPFKWKYVSPYATLGYAYNISTDEKGFGFRTDSTNPNYQYNIFGGDFNVPNSLIYGGIGAEFNVSKHINVNIEATQFIHLFSHRNVQEQYSQFALVSYDSGNESFDSIIYTSLYDTGFTLEVEYLFDL